MLLLHNPYKYNKVVEFKTLLKSELYDYMIKNDPEFRAFVEKNKGKAIEEIAREYNIDLDIFLTFL